jgi:hypothetical protein
MQTINQEAADFSGSPTVERSWHWIRCPWGTADGESNPKDSRRNLNRILREAS